VSAATNYVIGATNPAGSTTATVNIRVVASLTAPLASGGGAPPRRRDVRVAQEHSVVGPLPFVSEHPRSCVAAECPCENADPTAGCANSTGRGGLLLATGSAALDEDDLELFVLFLPPNEPSVVFLAAEEQAVPLGDGVSCSVPEALVPLVSCDTGEAGAFSVVPGLVEAAESVLAPGTRWHLQAWYRDPDGPCGSGFNATNGVSIAFEPAPVQTSRRTASPSATTQR
jgi:hypothetical protein